MVRIVALAALVCVCLSAPLAAEGLVLALGVLLGGLVGSWRFGARLPSLRYALIILSLALAWAWGVA